MSNYFIAPVSTEGPFSNYQKTVVRGVAPNVLRQEFKTPTTMFNEGVVRAWAVSSHKRSYWLDAVKGDLVFFYKNKHLISYSVLLGKVNNPDIARHLWGVASRSLIIYLTKPIDIYIPYSVINELSGYLPQNVCQTFMKFNPTSRANINSKYGSVEGFIKAESKENGS